LSATQEADVRKVAKHIYEILKLDGFSRSEFIFKDGQPHFLEINTIPGLTKESILPQQAAEAGISMSDLFDNAIQQALHKNP
jgi:D-alanine-D-alanine ligase